MKQGGLDFGRRERESHKPLTRQQIPLEHILLPSPVLRLLYGQGI
jgi:hypothetical protein